MLTLLQCHLLALQVQHHVKCQQEFSKSQAACLCQTTIHAKSQSLSSLCPHHAYERSTSHLLQSHLAEVEFQTASTLCQSPEEYWTSFAGHWTWWAPSLLDVSLMYTFTRRNTNYNIWKQFERWYTLYTPGSIYIQRLWLQHQDHLSAHKIFQAWLKTLWTGAKVTGTSWNM